MTYSCLLALVFTVSCFAPSTEVLSLPNETYVYPAAVFNATQQICSQETLRQEIINGIKQDSYRYIQEFLRVYNNCKDALTQGQTTSGVYTIQPDNQPAFRAYCDMTTDGGGWTVFQRRMDGSVDFYRYWADYRQGFGNLSGEFWLGLDKIHRLTSTGTQLRVDLQDFNGNSAYAQYTSFSVGDSSPKYTLSVSGYSGTAGDSLGVHNGYRFSTRDQDNDIWSSNCAQTYKGAWWYYSCYSSNLNGLYRNRTYLSDGVVWGAWRNPLKFVEMKLKLMYRDCKDALTQGQTISGVYTIQPDTQPAFQVYCDMTIDGGGWTVFQRRMDGSVNFYRYWTDYQQGFGSLSGEFWLGLDKIHRLTSSATQLRVDLRPRTGGSSTYAKYSSFSIGDSSSKYTLSVSGYSGTAGDRLAYHNGRRFTTRDQDNDVCSCNCAQYWDGGAWWYGACWDSNLNGVYSTYFHWGGHLSFSEMKLRRS